MANQLTDADYIDYQTIPHFPVSTVDGHVGRLIFGYLKGVPVMCMQGRFHYYEGYPLAKVSVAGALRGWGFLWPKSMLHTYFFLWDKSLRCL